MFRVCGLFLIIALVVATLFASTAYAEEASADTIKIVLPNYQGRDGRNHYVETLISTALSTQGLSADVVYHPLPSNVKRIEKLLTEEQAIDVAWLQATTSRTERMQYVPIPIFQGLHGTRLLLINQNRLEAFAQVNTLEQLKTLVGVQHHTWSDTSVLKMNGLSINGDLEYANMLRAIESGLADYFPRSAMTIHAEQRRLAARGIVIEPRLTLEYPSYFLLFVSNRQPDLQKMLVRGITKMSETGDFQRLFERFFDARFQSLDLLNRTKVALNNSALPQSLVSELRQGVFYKPSPKAFTD